MSNIQSFSFESSNLRIIDNQWFVAKDVCDGLDIKDSAKAVRDIENQLKSIGKPDTISNRISINTGGQSREVVCVNETGVNLLIFQSRKKSAFYYKLWIASEVLPAIRKTGKYEIPNEPQSPYIQDEQLNYIKKGVAKIVHSTGKSWQAVYNELFNHVQAPRLREIRKERYDDACVFLGVKIINHQIRTKNISISYIDKQNIQKMCQNIDTIYQYWDNLYLGLVNLNSNLIPYLGGPFNDAHFYSQEIRKCFNFD